MPFAENRAPACTVTSFCFPPALKHASMPLMSVPRLYLIFGDDEYLVSDKAKSILKACIPNAADAAIQVERIDGAVDKVEPALNAIRKCLSALNSLGLFSEDKTVFLENAMFLGDNRASQSTAVQDEMVRLTDKIKAGLPDGVTLIITAPGVDKRRAFYKACGKAGEVHEFKIPEDRSQKDHVAVNERLERMLAEKGITMSAAARNAFQQKVGLDTRVILNELEKLAVALGSRKKVEAADVAEFVSASREAAFWDLADAFANRDLAGSLRILRQLIFQRQNLMGLIINLENRIRDLMVYREAIDRKWMHKKIVYGKESYAWDTLPPEVEETLTQEMENDPRAMHPYRASILASQAAGFTRIRLAHCLKQVTLAHEQMVSSRVPPELIMEILLVRMLGSARRPAART